MFVMTERKAHALQVPLAVPYKALEKFSMALYGRTGGTYSAAFSVLSWQRLELDKTMSKNSCRTDCQQITSAR